ncbi:unnamed protein product [Didymodactylos carnosus]|uniref:Death domain-containing protein n=1 Tax=Didymodactylos carnosus TaxID=1234261 RepID=A0A813Z0N9_9BILA|nr:unnamed protein product [Didymodactylos carnosus]CAF3675970.1 unnamed protein product [Didymodactylos carnosus]
MGSTIPVIQNTENDVKAIAQQFVQTIDNTNQGYITQQQFITGIQRHFPADQLDEVLKFEIIPSHVLDAVNILPSLQGSASNLRDQNAVMSEDYGMSDVVSDDQIHQIAGHAARKNWQKLALCLGFLEYDIESYRVQNNNDPTQTMYALLSVWREQEQYLATKNRLKHCLQESGMTDLIYLLN